MLRRTLSTIAFALLLTAPLAFGPLMSVHSDDTCDGSRAKLVYCPLEVKTCAGAQYGFQCSVWYETDGDAQQGRFSCTDPTDPVSQQKCIPLMKAPPDGEGQPTQATGNCFLVWDCVLDPFGPPCCVKKPMQQSYYKQAGVYTTNTGCPMP